MTDKNSPATTESKAYKSQQKVDDKKVLPSGAADKTEKKDTAQAGSEKKKATSSKVTTGKVSVKTTAKTTVSKTAENKKISSSNKNGADKKTRNGVGWLALLLTLSATGAGYFVWQDLFSHTTNLIVQSDSNRSSLLTMQQQIKTLDQTFPSAIKQITLNTEQKMLGMQQSLDALGLAMSKLNNDDWLLSEVDYLLNIASHRLQLEGDIKTARRALVIADQRLKNFPHPGVLAVRKAIAKDQDALNKVADPDIAGLVFSLMAIQDTIENLPVKMSVTDMKKSVDVKSEVILQLENDGIESNDWRVIMDNLWVALRDTLSSLVTIRRVESQQIELLPVNEQAFLLQNLDLKLEAARLALIKRESVLYKANLIATRKWLQRYFNSQSPAVMKVMETLASLEQVELNPSLPDISVSMRALKSFKDSLIAAQVKQ